MPCICYANIRRDKAAALVTAVKQASSADIYPYVLPADLFDSLALNQEVFELAYCSVVRYVLVMLRKLSVWMCM